MVSVLHKELGYKVAKLKFKKVGGHAAEDLPIQLVNKLSQISPHQVLQSWLINAVYSLLVKNIRRRRGGGLNRECGLINFLPLKSGGGGLINM